MKMTPFINLLISQVIGSIGDTIYTIAVISSIFTLTHSPLAASVVPAVITASMFVSGLLTPLLTVKFALNRILLLTQTIKALILAILAGYMYFSSDTQVLIVYVLIACIAFMDGCAEPVSGALIPHYVKEDRLMRATVFLRLFFRL
ncbi:MAG: hypothetical protein ABF868_04770 [Sporolactobacillus sp.]